MRSARDIMNANLITVSPETTVTEMARIMVENRIRCLPVVDESGKLLGVVDEEDLVHQDARVHFPTFIHFLESYIILPSSLKRFEKELRRAVGSRASDVMDEEVVTVDPLCSVEEVATLMVDRDLEYVLVQEGDALVGVITRADILRAMASEGP